MKDLARQILGIAMGWITAIFTFALAIGFIALLVDFLGGA